MFAIPVTKLTNVIDKFRNNGIDVMVEVGYDPVCQNGGISNVSMQNAATIAANLVDLFNNPNTGIYRNQPIKYWVLANEPDHNVVCSPPNFGGFGLDGTGNPPYSVSPSADAAVIISYIQEFATKMKNKDASIKIIAPEFSAFGSDVFYEMNKMMKAICMDPIMGTFTTSNNQTVFYLDQLTIHSYPSINSRSEAIDNPSGMTHASGGLRGKFEQNISNEKGLVPLITSNSTRNIQNLSVGLTEYNIGNSNLLHEVSDLNQVVGGYDYRSFLGGQWLALMLQEGMRSPWLSHMNFWSMREGDQTAAAPDNACNIGRGYISNCAQSQNKKRSTYHHFSMASHMKGKYYSGTQGGTPTTLKVEAFAAIQSAGFYVMIVNGNDDGILYPFRINFNNSGASHSSGSNTNLKFDFTINNDSYFQTGGSLYYESPATKMLQPKSTVFLRFDCQRNLQDRKDYTETDFLNDQQPQVTQVGNTPVDANQAACGQPGGIGGTIVGNHTYAHQTVIVNNDLLIASNSKLTFDSAIVIFTPGTKITSTPMAALEIKNSKLIGCGNQKWGGIHMLGNFNNGERLYIEHSVVYHADKPVNADRIPDIKIKNSVFANGIEAIDLDRSQTFEITGNIIAGFTTGIKTRNTLQDFVSKIRENKIVEVLTGMDFKDDKHTMLEIACNEIRFQDRGIKSRNSELQEQGTPVISAGNLFVRDLPGSPQNYIDHVGGPTKYYFGPAEAGNFTFPNVMNIPKVQAGLDNACQQVFSVCGNWIDQPYSVNDAVVPKLNAEVFPNPNNGTFNVSLADVKGESLITICDALGKTITSQKTKAAERTASFTLTAPGLYFISIDNNGQRTTGKVIVSNSGQ